MFLSKSVRSGDYDDSDDDDDDDNNATDADLGELLLMLRHLLDHLAEVPHALGPAPGGRGDPLLFVECLKERWE